MEDGELFTSCLGGDSIDFRDSFGIEHCTSAALEWIEWEEKVHTRYNLFSDSPVSAYCEKGSETASLDTDGGSTANSAPDAILSSSAPVAHSAGVPPHPLSVAGERTNAPAATDGESTEPLEGLSSNKQRCYFDSDTLALKHNPHYQQLLKTLALLEAQKMQAIKDIEVLTSVKSEAERDPLAFVNALKEGALGPLPMRQEVAEMPDINWKSYIDSLHSVLKQSNMYFNTRRQMTSRPIKSVDKKHSGTHDMGSKPSSYRQPWTIEEQARFEELLRIYPPEPVERRRFEKISKALGTRTTQQVASHVQKYFLKLAKAGLPVPGRIPNLANYVRNPRRGSKRHFNRPSMFFSAMAPRVMMEGDSRASSQDGTQQDTSDDDDDDDDDNASLSDLLDGPSDDVDDGGSPVKCVSCDHQVCTGVYWKCAECSPDTPTILCHNCIDSDYSNGGHNPSHELEEMVISQSSFTDRDYTTFAPHAVHTTYNYLDPNFHPPV